MESIFSDGSNKEKSYIEMMTLGYLYSKFFKKIIRGKTILNSKIDKTAKVYSGCLFYNSSLGKYSYLGYDCEIQNCEIGAFCSIAGSVIIGGAQHPLNWVSTSPVFYNIAGGTGRHLGDLTVSETKKTTIGNDVWIGHRAIIMAGVNVGDGAVIGAGAVVTKDVPSYAIVAGVPAQIIRYRFDQEIIQKIKNSKWWDLSDEILRGYSKYMNNPNVFCDCLLKCNRQDY